LPELAGQQALLNSIERQRPFPPFRLTRLVNKLREPNFYNRRIHLDQSNLIPPDPQVFIKKALALL
jgi:hypothetical protein